MARRTTTEEIETNFHVLVFLAGFLCPGGGHRGRGSHLAE
jgi:hypothetical protein